MRIPFQRKKQKRENKKQWSSTAVPKDTPVGLSIDFGNNPQLLLNFLTKFCDLTGFAPDAIKWYYAGDDIENVSYEDIDDRTSVAHITKRTEDTIKIKSITIGASEKKQICTSFLIHNPYFIHHP